MRAKTLALQRLQRAVPLPREGTAVFTARTPRSSGPEGPLVSAGGSDVAPDPCRLQLWVWPDPLLSDCIEPVRRTILNARAPSTRRQYENSGNCFLTGAKGEMRTQYIARCLLPLSSCSPPGRRPVSRYRQ
ncbi:hypothetical protein F7725_000139, partial [Dissostichus mawsoni]